MKKIIFNFLSSCLVFILFAGISHSQSIFHKSKLGSKFIYGDILANPSGDGSLIEARVSQPVLKAFYASFPNVSQVKWYRLEKYYLVHFTKNENENKALYDVKGRPKYSISYGTERDLPAVVRKLIKREYVEYNILQAIEVNEKNRNIWIINLDEADEFVTVRVENNNIEEMARYTKSKL